MKLRHLVMFFALAAVVIIGLGSCNFFGVSITDRITMFVDDLNSTRTETYTNFDSATTLDYQAIQAIGFWDLNFPAPASNEQPYEVQNLSTLDPSNVTGTIVGPPLFDASSVGRAIRFVMVKVGVDYYIQQLYLDNSATATVKKPF